MKKKAFVYNLINVLVLLAAGCILVRNYSLQKLFADTGAVYIGVMLLTVLLVHFLKAIRLYFALYGANISFSQYLKIYCKVTPVSILLPFKSGELFRMYCYGNQTGNMLKGVITVVLDRFMDTIALLTMIIAVWTIYGGVITPLVYILLLFVVAVIIVFVVFPGVYRYWNKYLLRADATVRKMRAIKLLNKFNLVYQEIANVTKGRGIILYILSLLAWIIEIGSVSLLYRLYGARTNVNAKISEYLSSALSSSQAIELKQFIFISVILMICIYVIVKLIDVATVERN